MCPRIDLSDFVQNGRFGPFDRKTCIERVTAILGPPDPWVTYPGSYAYGNIGFEHVAIDSDYQLNVQFSFQHPEHFHLPFESWRQTAELSWSKLLYDWPDSRFDIDLGPFRSGATLDSLCDKCLLDGTEIESGDVASAPPWRSFQMTSGVTVTFSRVDMDGQYTLYNLMTTCRWGPARQANKRMYVSDG